MIRQLKLNITADIDELREFYNILSTQFLDRKWIATEQKAHIKREAYNDPNIDLTKMASGWGLQHYLHNRSLPCPPWNVIEKQPAPLINTDMVFGIAQRILDKIPMAYRLGVSETPGGNYIESHTDDAWHVHFPIHSPSQSFFTWNDENDEPVEWVHYKDDGSAWALNTTLKHSVKNLDTEKRVHMFFSVQGKDIPALLEISGKI
jgi:hypothetical protein